MTMPWGNRTPSAGRKGRACLVLAAAGICIFSIQPMGVASAQTYDGKALQRQVQELKVQVRDLRRRLTNMRAELRQGAGPRARKISQEEIPPTVAARFEVRMSQLERSIRKLTGKVEDLAFSVRRSRKDSKKLENDFEYRISKLERGAPTGGAKATASRVDPPKRVPATGRTQDRAAPASKAGVLPTGTPAQQYRFAYGLMRRRENDKAIQAFQEFVQKHPRSRLSGNAYHWLGQLYFDRRKYTNAAQNFAAGYQKFKRHARAAENLLMLGVSLARIKKKNLACQSFAELRSSFPNTAPQVRRRARVERRKLGCR